MLTTPALAVDSTAPVIPPCENYNQSLYTATIESTNLTGRVDTPSIIKIHLEPEADNLPFGHFIVSLADITLAPDGPQPAVLTGSHEIKVVPKVAGDYQFMVRVNLVTKSSCGGAEASTLLKETVQMTVIAK